MRGRKYQKKTGSQLWTVIYIAANRAMAERLTEILCQEGILAKARPVGGAGEREAGMHEILVLASEVSEAHTILCEQAIR